MSSMNWKKRSEKFNNIGWVKNQSLLSAIKNLMDLDREHVVLDAGIGTGVLSKYIIDDVKEIHGIDYCENMMDFIDDKRIHKYIGDIKNQHFFEDEKFDRIVLRNVLHHCVGCIDRAMDECYRVLKPEGKIVISEGIAFNNNCYSDFAQIVTSRENRLVFTEEDMARWMRKFSILDEWAVILKNQSINNWLDNCVENDDLKEKIKNIHKASSEIFKESVNLREEKDDIFVDMKVFIISGIKNDK